jgi:hypothetical protein
MTTTTQEPASLSVRDLELKLKAARLVDPAESLPTPPSSNSSGSASPPEHSEKYEENYFL